MDDEWATRLRLWIEAIDNDDAGAIWPRDVEAALDEIERLRRERDEARELAAGLDDGGRVAAVQALQMRRERNEARNAWRDVAQEVKRQDAQIEALRADVERLHSENARLLNDRARFPDRPDGIGRMIEAHLANLRALRVEADKRISRLRDENERLQADLAAARELAAGMDDGGRVAAQEAVRLRWERDQSLRWGHNEAREARRVLGKEEE